MKTKQTKPNCTSTFNVRGSNFNALLTLLLLALPAAVQAEDYTYMTNDGSITITSYSGPGGAVIIPDMITGLPVTSIGSYAFSDCTSLTNVTIPNSVTSIGDRAFHLCIRLSVITVEPSNLAYSSVDGVLFNQNQTALIQYPAAKNGSQYTIPNTVTNIGDSGFFHCHGLTSVTIPNSVNRIGGWAFSGCDSLTSVTIPNSVTSIGDRAFLYCTSLTNVTIPNSVTNIGNYAFCDCSGLRAIMVDTNNLAYSSVDGVLFNQNQTALIQYPAGKDGSQCTIPDSVTNIGGFAFSDCTSLNSITIPNSVTSIGDAEPLWPGTFQGCTSLTNVTIGNSVTYIGDAAFFDCYNLTSLTIGNSVANIGRYALSGCTRLKGVTIPNSVANIGDGAFSSCRSLTSITIPDSVTSIGGFAFSYCTSLTSVYFKGNVPSDGGDVFGGANSATVYYLPGTIGWGTTFASRPTALWVLPYPLVLNNGPSFGAQTNGFGFIISWATNLSVVVEACTDLTNPIWAPVDTNTLADGWSYFSDPQWTSYPARFYRIRSP